MYEKINGTVQTRYLARSRKAPLNKSFRKSVNTRPLTLVLGCVLALHVLKEESVKTAFCVVSERKNNRDKVSTEAVNRKDLCRH